VTPFELVASAEEEAIRLIPSLLWILFAAVALAVFYRPIRYELLPRLSSLKLPGGIELTLKNHIDDAAKQQGVQVSEDDKTRIVRRLERSQSVVRGASILWIDDTPQNNANESSILTTFGAQITTAKTSAEAEKQLKKGRFDLVISDIRREGEADKGLRFLEQHSKLPSTIFYVRDCDEARGTPPHAFAITNRPHQLLHYVLDALERGRG
jgi:CheY-like chemotaxis protein